MENKLTCCQSSCGNTTKVKLKTELEEPCLDQINKKNYGLVCFNKTNSDSKPHGQ